MDTAAKAALMIIATAAVIAGLFFFRAFFIQLALAFVLFIAVEGVAGLLCQRWHVLKRRYAIALAVTLMLIVAGMIGYVIVDNAASFAEQADSYRSRLNQVVSSGHVALGLAGKPPTVDELFARLDPGQFIGQVAGAMRTVAGDAVLILIYVAFMFLAAHEMPKKLDRIFPDPARRQEVAQSLTRIRSAMIEYLWVTIILGLATSAVIFPALLALGFDGALFWSLLIFLLSFIPTIGPLIAVALPTVFALIQYDELWRVLAVFAVVGGSQFIVGNFIQPRLMGASLNLSALVVLLAVAFWGSLWGIAGAFLAAPLTVMLMIVLARFDGSRWIAVLLSENAKPEEAGRISMNGRKNSTVS